MTDPRLLSLIETHELGSDFALHRNLLVAAEQMGPAATGAVLDEMERLSEAYGHDVRVAFVAALTGADRIVPRPVAEADFNAARSAARGMRNPEPFLPPFWSEQIRTMTSGYGAAMRHLGAHDHGAPIWSFDRFGQSFTLLDDGRWVVIGGEHEDHYDSDFCIYADVTVFDTEGGVVHFIYPEDAFPPTDFHSATLMGDHILLIGSLGYPERRREGETQVLRLELSDFSIRPLETTGDGPGWIHSHRADLIDGLVVVSEATVEPGYRALKGDWALDPRTLVWSRWEDPV